MPESFGQGKENHFHPEGQVLIWPNLLGPSGQNQRAVLSIHLNTQPHTHIEFCFMNLSCKLFGNYNTSAASGQASGDIILFYVSHLVVFVD